MNSQILAVSPTKQAPELPLNTIPQITEWSVLAVVAVFLIRYFVQVDKANREANKQIMDRLLDEVCDEKESKPS